VNGLYLNGADWDVQNDSLVDLPIGKLNNLMPIILFEPV